MMHPILQRIKGGKFVGNDIEIDEEKNVMILTGANMGGKSTILRTFSIIVILGQMGCYVPAKYASFSIIDRIFTRIGATDKLM